MAQRLDRLLEYISAKQTGLGSFVSFNGYNQTPEAIQRYEVTKHGGEAASECANGDEINFLIDELIKNDLLTKGPGHDWMCEVRLNSRGHAKLAELAVANQTSAQVFVAMWFNSSVQSAYDNGVAKAIEDIGFKPLRIDRKEHNNKIDDEIIAEIRRSRFIVADMTCEPGKPRGGVYFEAGFAMGLRIPVIWTCREDAIAEVHFDTRQFSHILWTDAADLRDKLAKRIAATIGDGPLKRL